MNENNDDDCFNIEEGNDYDVGEEITGLVCFSGGKDSTAMLLRMIELDDPIKYPITRICFADTTFEFPDLYAYIDHIQLYLDSNYPERGFVIEKLQSKRTWDDWFYGEITRGKAKGAIRGAPFTTQPCWWSREAKVTPLEKAAKEINANFQFIGIAADETRRISKNPKTIRYPLVDWGWTEQDCMAYLEHLGIPNSLYENFNRLGCFHCIKAGPADFHATWANHPEEWKIAKHYSAENTRLVGRNWIPAYTLEELEELFEQGFVPKRHRELECNTCNAVSFFSDGTVEMEDFDTDEAIEHDPRFKDSSMNKTIIEEAKEKIEWVPPSQRATKGLGWI